MARRSTSGGRTTTTSARFTLPDGSRSAQSVWIWRAFLLLALIAVGICLSLAVDGRPGFAAAWGVIAAGWFGISMMLWRRHLQWAAAERRRSSDPRGNATAEPRRTARR